MIKKAFEKFEYQLIAEEPVDFEQNLKLFEEMLKFARELGVFPPEDPLEGIEKDIYLAKVLKSLKVD
ncbi:MAG: hypothetical protein C0169_00855 [Thermodesulfobacterium geofontis]|uniref:Uncharacterized protein n=1 Tax=Thermodesulfobacterium geofontis TaxID=1295609 RepID=A0A2N7QGE4_9BACT|nr:MAG: hypothetical protein C0169_00855 [Thermodesulfobacterium geofontis]